MITKKKQRVIAMLQAAKLCHYPVCSHSHYQDYKNKLSIWTKDNRFVVDAPIKFWRWM